MTSKEINPYYAVEDEENFDEKGEENGDMPLLRSRARGSSKHHRLVPFLDCNLAGGLLIFVGFVSTILLTSVWIYWLQLHNNGLIKATSYYSPMLDRLNVPLKDQLTDATMFPDASNASHIYRLPPSPEVDAAWERIANIGIHAIEREDVIKLGKNPDEAIIPPDYWGLGGKHMAEIEVFHQIHCLNAMRQALVTNYDYYWGDRFGLDPPLMFATHLNHCTNMILQALMCHADLDAITYVWREGQDKPFPDFSTWKVCKDFNAILEWQESVQMPKRDEKWDQIVKPADAVQLPVTPGLHEMGEGTGSVDGIPTAPLPGLTGALGHCRRDESE
jgi:hypothetical protein